MFFAVPLSAFTMLGSGSVGVALTSSTKAVQYLNEDEKAVVPSVLK